MGSGGDGRAEVVFLSAGETAGHDAINGEQVGDPVAFGEEGERGCPGLLEQVGVVAEECLLEEDVFELALFFKQCVQKVFCEQIGLRATHEAVEKAQTGAEEGDALVHAGEVVLSNVERGCGGWG